MSRAPEPPVETIPQPSGSPGAARRRFVRQIVPRLGRAQHCPRLPVASNARRNDHSSRAIVLAGESWVTTPQSRCCFLPEMWVAARPCRSFQTPARSSGARRRRRPDARAARPARCSGLRQPLARRIHHRLPTPGNSLWLIPESGLDRPGPKRQARHPPETMHFLRSVSAAASPAAGRSISVIPPAIGSRPPIRPPPRRAVRWRRRPRSAAIRSASSPSASSAHRCAAPRRAGLVPLARVAAPRPALVGRQERHPPQWRSARAAGIFLPCGRAS